MLSALVSVCKQCKNFISFRSEASTVYITKSSNVNECQKKKKNFYHFPLAMRAALLCSFPELVLGVSALSIKTCLIRKLRPFCARLWCSTRTVKSLRNFAQSLDFTSLLEYKNLLFRGVTLSDQSWMRWRFRRAHCRCKE